MANILRQIDRIHQSKQGLLFFALVEAGLAYVFASWAIDSGSLFQWIVAIVLGIGVLQNLAKLAYKLIRKGA